MGNNQSDIFKPLALTPQLLSNSVNAIFQDKLSGFQQKAIDLALRAIVQEFQYNLIFNLDEEKKTIVNKTALQIFYQKKQNFEQQLMKLLNFLCQKLQVIMKSTAFILVKRQDWKICLDIAFFLMIFTDQKTLSIFESLSVRSDLNEQTKKLVDKLQNQNGQFQSRQFISDRLQTSSVQRIEKCMRISLHYLIKLKNQFLTRSQKTMQIIQPLEQSLFMIYLKLYFSPAHHATISKRARSQFFRTNITIGSYFLAYGVSYSIGSLYESSVVFIDSLLQKNPDIIKKMNALPSPLFKNLPIVSNNCMYEYILLYIFYALCFVKENNQVYIRFVCNRIMSLKLAQTILDQLKTNSQQITFYLEQLCIQVKAAQIERAFLTQLASKYLKIQQQTKKKIKVSPVLQKFKDSSKFTYTLNFSNKKYKVTTEQLVTELQNDENTFQKQFRLYCQKFIYNIVLKKQVITFFDDKFTWSEVLQNLGDLKEYDDNKPSINWGKNTKKEQSIQKRMMKKQKHSDDQDQGRIDLQQQDISQRTEQKAQEGQKNKENLNQKPEKKQQIQAQN